jgi:hypothetical protein
MDEMQNVAANLEEVATPQDTVVESTETATETTIESSEQPAETTKPDVTETQAFSRRLKEATSKAKDELIAEMYGDSHGIFTYADYQKAVKESQEAEERARLQEELGVDPDKLKPVFEKFKENDPDFQELRQIRAEKNIHAALSDLNNELKSAGIDLQLNDLSDAEVAKLPNVDKIVNLIKTKGHSLADAFFIANKKDIIAKQAAKAEQEAIKKITANGASSPGSLSSGNETITFTKEQVDAMSQKEVMKNYDLIMKSMKNWK